MNRSGLQIPSLKIMNEEFVIKLKEVAAIIRHKSAAFKLEFSFLLVLLQIHLRKLDRSKQIQTKD